MEVEKRSAKEPGAVHYPLVSDARSLVWLANQNSITPHVWCARVPKLHEPDLCVFDLDPPRRTIRRRCGRPRSAVRDLLDELGLPSFVKTSGSKGFHILVPLEGEIDFETVWRFAHGAGAVLVKRHPEVFTQEFIKADRAGRIFMDTGRNGPGATFAAVYAVQTEARGARVRAVHLAGGRARRRRPAHVHAANDGRPHRVRSAISGARCDGQRALAARRAGQAGSDC